MTDQRSSSPASCSNRGSALQRRPRFAVRPLALALAGASLLSLLPGMAGNAQAQANLPTGMTVIQGQVNAVTSGNKLTVTNSAGSILNWQGFSIGAGNAVTFVQPNAQSAVLNRVVGNDPSSILGSLSSNGRVWLLNPNGVIFGQGARIDVGGLVTSTLNLNDADWLAGQGSGRFKLFGDSTASIVNQGELRSSLGGHIALLGGSVRNEGLIEAPNGQILLAAGKSIELIDTGSPNLRLKVTAPDGEALNLGTLQAANGRIDVHGAVVNQQGIARVDSLTTNAAGEIVLSASQNLNLGKDSVTSASGATGGKITLDSGAAGTTLVSGAVLATGSAGAGAGAGGSITALGKNVGVVDNARLDASGSSAGGQIHVGGGERGQDAAFRNADGVYIGREASLAADATANGDGGKIVLWGNEATRAYGSFSARGGPQGGNGGFIETSGHWIDVNPVKIDATAVAGLAGTWLLDPYNITITETTDTGPVGITTGGTPTNPTYTSSANDATIPSSVIRSQLNAGNNVTIATGAGGTQAGNINVTGVNLAVAPTTATTLTLQAHRDITVIRSTISSSDALLGVTLQAGIGGTGRVLVQNSTITTRGGSIDMRGIGFESTDSFNSYGIWINNAQLNAGAGLINLNATGVGSVAGRFARASYLSGATLTAGTINVTGTTTTTGTTSGAGVDLSNGTSLTAGTISLSGTAQSADASSTGVGFDSSSVTATRALTIAGTGKGNGVFVGSGTTLQVTPSANDPSAALSINGTSTLSDFSTASYSNAGVDISGQYGGTLRATNGAALSVTGSNLGGTYSALFLRSGLVIDAATGGNAVLRGVATGPGVVFLGAPAANIGATARVGGTLRVLADSVTLINGSTLRSDATGDALVVAGVANPNTITFNNQGGATALNTPNGRWLVYGANTGAVTAGGLAYDFKQYNARFGETNSLTPATGNGLLYSDAPVVTLNVNNVSKVYDGTVATGPLVINTVSGQRDNDKPTGTVTGSFDTKDAGSNKVVTINPSSTLFTDALDKPVLGYQYASNARGDILRKNLTLGTVSAADKVYDGNTVANVTVGPLVGLVGSETLTTSASGNFDTKDVGNAKLVTLNITTGNGANGGLASNYVAPAGANTRAAITPADLVIRANDASKPFGTTLVFSGSEFSSTGLVGGETIGSVTLNSTGAPATASVAGGPYAIFASNAVGGSFSASNYKIAYVNGTLTVTPVSLAAVLVSIVGNPTKVYDGSDVATLTSANYALSGFVGSDAATVNQTNGRYDSANAGARTVTANLATTNYTPLGSTDLTNYTLPTSASGAGTITPRTLTLTGLAANNKVYDGNVAATLSNTGSLTGLVGSQTLVVSNTGASFDTKDAGIGKTVTVNGLALANGSNGGLAVNYAVASSASTTADITPKTLTAGSVSAANKVYDGNTVASVTLGALTGLVGSETLGSSASGNFDTKDAGTGKTVTVNGALSNGTNGGLAGNYRLAPTATTANITPKALTVVATAANKVYDGNTGASILIGSLNGLVGAETLSFSATGNFNTKDVGVAKPVTVATSGLANGSNGGLASNYTVTPFALSADITPRTLTLGPVTAANKVYDGNALASVGIGTLGNLVGNETLTTAATGSFDTKDVGTNKLVSIAVALGNGSNGGLASNYRLPTPTPTARADITPATLTYTANPANKIVGAPLPALSGAVSGFVAGETQGSATTGNLAFVTPALTTSPAGQYAINGSGLTATNYAFVQAAGNATALTVTGLEVQQTDQGSQSALSQSLAVVTPTKEWSSPSEGRVLDVFQVLSGNFLAQGSLFSSIPVADFSQDQLTTLLAARDSYKKGLFAEAIRKLEQDPKLADAPACQSTKEVDNGTCLITEDLKKQLRAEREGVQIAAGQAPAPAAAPAATPPAAPAPATTAPSASPTPAPTPAPAPQVAALAPPVADTPSLLRRRVRSASLPQIERKIAIVIGVDRYTDKTIPQLDNSVRDANSVGRLLETTLGYDTVVLPNASKATVIRTLNRLAIEAGPNDSVVVYYAGHGDVVPATGLGYWQLTDSNAKRPETWLSNADITRLIGQIGASQVALISDSCYSGSLVDERLRGIGGTVDPQTLLTRKTVVVMSSGGNEPVFDSGKQGHSPFAFSLMNNLQQVATWQAGGNVFERIRFAVARELPQRPRYGTASAAGHQAGGDYLFEQRQLDATP